MKKLFNFRPMLFSTILFVLGIFVAYITIFFKPLYSIIAFAVAIFSLAIIFLFSLVADKKYTLKKAIACICVVAVFFLLGFSVFVAKIEKENSLNAVVEGEFCGNISEVATSEDGVEYIVSNLHKNGKKQNYKLKLLSQTEDFAEGDKVAFSGEIEKISIYSQEFGFSVSDQISKIKYSANTQNLTSIEKTGEAFAPISRLRGYIRTTLAQRLNEDVYPVAYAMMVGERSLISEEIYDNFLLSGVVHIFAVSGMHFSLLIMLFVFVAKKFKWSTLTRFFVIFPLITLYALLCGFSPSVVRAYLMGIIALICPIFFVRYDSLNALAISALCILIYNPLCLFSISFLLSFSAMLGIILLYSPTNKHLKFLPKYIRQTIAMSVSAQVGVFAVSVHFFNLTYTYSILSNILLAPIIFVAYSSLFVCTTLFLPFAFLRFLFYIPQGFFQIMLLATSLIAKLPTSTLLVYSLAFGGGILLLATIVLSNFVNLKLVAKVVTAVCLIFCTIAMYFYENSYVLTKNSFATNQYFSIMKDDDGKISVFDYGGYAGVTLIKNLKYYRITDIENYFVIRNDSYIDAVLEVDNYFEIENVYVAHDFSITQQIYMNFLNDHDINTYLVNFDETKDVQGKTFCFVGENSIIDQSCVGLRFSYKYNDFLFSQNANSQFANYLSLLVDGETFDFFITPNSQIFEDKILAMNIVGKQKPQNSFAEYHSFETAKHKRIVLDEQGYRIKDGTRLRILEA